MNDKNALAMYEISYNVTERSQTTLCWTQNEKQVDHVIDSVNIQKEPNTEFEVYYPSYFQDTYNNINDFETFETLAEAEEFAEKKSKELDVPFFSLNEH